ncbi:cyclic nucleotide-binding domain-containing protein 2-like isoform X4 [Mauremys reevesii]|nr:cyclic nucleotide-binding domain-containing protein 2-like isoform X4 [Mauremys reevesii]XP_039403308.1 cyclic nucleotide-binding domain-containing protein 2-like isoform X4 [Mauremys reevesii]XP_039403309.1 cyclic nucleotide-binding domain-containing protein 2-like isoform X4 [Mauremys reevesii]XP_039403310.1 cyclic nucleotide-binding domain-containing protein 2-like isoform X4 [Mauremys reevesii]XP_039403311.1 cyclic nucleotide-binding domain-containing protein 2-like isoform X4 [Mauremys 
MLLDTETRKASILASLQALGEDSANGRNRRNHRRKLISGPSPTMCGCLPPGKLLHGSRFTDRILQRGNLTGSLALERVKLTKAKLGKKFRIPKGKGDSRWALSQSLQEVMSSAQEDQACFQEWLHEGGLFASIQSSAAAVITHSSLNPNLLFRFQKAAKSIVMLCLLYREHHLLANLNYGIERVKRWKSQLNHMEQSKEEILFDVTLFRAKKQSRISERAIHILRQCPQERSEKDISYILITLQPVKAFGNYSTMIQKKVAKAGWYSRESVLSRYESCQVMIQQGYTPHSFYICLSGSATVIKRNNDSGQVKPAWFFSRGDAFGDREIINGDYWQTTVIIQEPAEFLCIDREDFIKIFLSGGKKVFGDPEQMRFLRSLHYFKGWPINLLEDNPGKCIICHYRRGTVILRNSSVTEWIYIVKEGSCSVLKIFKDDSCLSNRAPTNRIMQAEVGIHKSLLTSRTETPVIIAIDTLLQGSVFGLLDFFFEDQPNLCVVSNGAECLKISKKFYLHHASKDLLQRLRKKERSYPSDAELKEQLQQEIQWQIFRKAALKSTVQQIELKRKLLQHCYMSKGLYPWCKN